MKTLRRVKFYITVLLALNIALVVFSIFGGLHYFTSLNKLKSDLNSHVASEHLESLGNKSLNEILLSTSSKAELHSLLNATSFRAVSSEELLVSLKSLETWLVLYIFAFVLSLCLFAACLIYARHKWNQIVKKQILRLVEEAVKLSAKHAKGEDYLEDVIYAVLDVYDLGRYKHLIKIYFKDGKTKRAA